MPLRNRMGKVGKTRRQIRRENRGWTFSSSSPRPRPTRRHSSPRHIENYAPFHKKTTTSSSHSAWRSVSSKRSGRGLKTRKSRK